MKKHFLDIAREMDLLHFEEHSPGAVFWHPNGFALLENLKAFIREKHRVLGYREVKSPCIVGSELFERSGHLAKFRENMFLAAQPDREGLAPSGYALRPMSCPNHISIFENAKRSYRELPYRLFEFGLVFRNEPSGSLLSLFRLREFTQDDSHIFARQSGVSVEVSRFLRMAREAYCEMGFQNIRLSISLRPEERVGDDAMWDAAEEALRQACRDAREPFSEIPGGGAFYGPKLEIGLEDSLGRIWQMGVIQLDYALPERFGLRFSNEDDKEERPVLLHHAVLGSLERFIGILLESFGKDLPSRLLPSKCAVVPVSEKFLEPAEAAFAQLLNIDAVLDRSDGPLPAKIAKLKSLGIPYILVIGQRELESQSVCVSGGGLIQKRMPISAFAELLQGAIAGKS